MAVLGKDLLDIDRPVTHTKVLFGKRFVKDIFIPEIDALLMTPYKKRWFPFKP